MTRTFSFAGAIVLSLVAIAWATDKPGDKPAASETPKATSATFMVTGLHCPACVKTVEGSLSKAQGIRSIKVDFDAKNAKVEFDESVVPAAKVEQLIAATPHMMGPSMHYDAWLALKSADVKDDATAAKAKDVLKKVAGVKTVTTIANKHVIEVQFTADGKTTSQQLIAALATAGIKAENF